MKTFTREEVTMLETHGITPSEAYAYLIATNAPDNMTMEAIIGSVLNIKNIVANQLKAAGLSGEAASEITST